MRECILCGRPVNIVGIYRPSDGGASIGALAGKERHVVYGVCNRCLRGGARQVAEAAEAIIHTMLGDHVGAEAIFARGGCA